MFSLLNLLQKENELYLHIVEYNDLICDTNKQLVWMYDPKNKQSFRINKNKVEEKLADGLVLGRQMAPYKE